MGTIYNLHHAKQAVLGGGLVPASEGEAPTWMTLSPCRRLETGRLRQFWHAD